MSRTERKAMIRKDHTDLSLTKQSKLLKISRSSLYYTPVGVDAETLKLMNEIDRVFTKIPVLWQQPDRRLFAGKWVPRRPASGSASDGDHGVAGYLQRPKSEQEASPVPDLSLFAPEAANHPPEPRLVH